jgi:DtxR family Mn-dependent transcriptional regulator
MSNKLDDQCSLGIDGTYFIVMPSHNILNSHTMDSLIMSESEEMYLVTIYQLTEDGDDETISISQLADALSIKPVSANQMIHKLSEDGLVQYEPYKGVALLPEGQRKTRRVLRHRRLWEFFLVELLDVPPQEADALACRLEHITPIEIAEQLSKYLGEPTTSPQGKSIPDIDGEVYLKPIEPLSALEAGRSGEVIHIEQDDAISDYLKTAGIKPGVEVDVLAASDRGLMLVREGEHHLSLTSEAAERILIRRIPE